MLESDGNTMRSRALLAGVYVIQVMLEKLRDCVISELAFSEDNELAAE